MASLGNLPFSLNVFLLLLNVLFFTLSDAYLLMVYLVSLKPVKVMIYGDERFWDILSRIAFL